MEMKLVLAILLMLKYFVQGDIILDMAEDIIKEFNINCVTFVQDDRKTAATIDLVKKLNIQIKFTDQDNKNLLRKGRGNFGDF